MALKTKNQGELAWLFIIFIFVTTFFVMNLFISVIVGQFNEQKKKSEGIQNLSAEKREWVKIQRFMAEVKTPVLDLPPTNFIRLQIYHFVRLEWFDHFITAIILMNTVTMCMDYYGASESYENVLEMNYIF